MSSQRTRALGVHQFIDSACQLGCDILDEEVPPASDDGTPVDHHIGDVACARAEDDVLGGGPPAGRSHRVHRHRNEVGARTDRERTRIGPVNGAVLRSSTRLRRLCRSSARSWWCQPVEKGEAFTGKERW